MRKLLNWARTLVTGFDVIATEKQDAEDALFLEALRRATTVGEAKEILTFNRRSSKTRAYYGYSKR